MADEAAPTASTGPFLAGKFALYNTADGGVHLSYRPEDAEEDQHLQIPGWMLKVAASQKSGGLMRMFHKIGG